MLFTTLHSVDTEYSADSVEWCAQDETHGNYIACGTYQLTEEAEVAATNDDTHAAKRSRKGRIYLFAFDTQDGELKQLQSLETAAILDMKWLPAWSCDTGPLLATVNALGVLAIYELLYAEERLQQRAQLAVDAATGDAEPALALALDWQCADGGDAVQLLVSDSRGSIHQLLYTAQGELKRVIAWHAHCFEAWTCAFDRWSPQRVYSGGDDCVLHAYDLRSGSDAEQPQRAWVNRAHGAGVTCLLSHPQREHQLLTGSYDELLRLFDTRSMKRSLAELNLNGGIWRLKSHPQRSDLILAACMYKNFSVVDLSESAPSLVGTYEEHSSICYGADWSPNIDKMVSSEGSADKFYMVTCSFYDHKMCVTSIVNKF